MRLSRAAAILMLTVASLLTLPSSGVGEWAELSWVGDEPDCFCVSGSGGQMIAVGFAAPEWARVVTGAKFYVCNDQLDHPIDPGASTSKPFLVRLWHPSGSLWEPPGHPWTEGISTTVCSAYSYCTPEDAWLEVELDEPFLLEPEPNGQGRVFFVGMEWQHRLSPYIGRIAFAGPTHLVNWRWTTTSWERAHEGDLMIRVIVADAAGTPVELGSWGCLKARYTE